MNRAARSSKRQLWQVIFSFFYLFIFPLILFLLAGDWRWMEGWIFSIIFCVLSFATVLYLYFKDPELLNERFGSPVQKEQKSWDKILLSVFFLGFLVWFAIMPLDARRFHWSPEFPVWIKITGAVILLVGLILLFEALKENTFAAPVIKMQKERGQKVISSGLYGIVRHPMYTGGALLFLGTPLLLDSIYGLVAGLLLTILLAVRTFGEEAMLKQELDGYIAYMKKVKWRLIPFLFTLFCFTVVIPQQPTQSQRPGAPAQASASPTPTPEPLPPPTVNIENYRAAAGRIIGFALTSDKAYRRLSYLTDTIGNRLSGSKSLKQAIQWAVNEMKKDKLDNVRAEKVMVPHWVRGEESVELVTPVARKLPMLGLGNSVATPPEGITAEAVVVRSFDELDALGEHLRGKIVVYNAPFTNYGTTVRYRGSGASRAARYGAVAALVRSITPVSLQTPHTGAMNYEEGQPKIPTAAITIEGAELLQRMYDRNEHPTLRLKMEAKFLPDAESANVVADLKGSEKPDEIVLIGGHFDSWDVGQGAHDDGGGCIISWEAVRLLKELGLRPRRTIRVVLFTNEENGTRGGDGYRDAHGTELANHVLAIETDSGIFKPQGFGLAATAPTQARANLQEIARLLSGIGADRISTGGGGTDIGPIMRAGVVGAGLNVDGTTYFDIHHTAADTLDKIDPKDLALCVATMAVMAYTVADMPQPLK